MHKSLYLSLLGIAIAMILLMLPRSEQTGGKYGYAITDSDQTQSLEPFATK